MWQQLANWDGGRIYNGTGIKMVTRRGYSFAMVLAYGMLFLVLGLIANEVIKKRRNNR